MGLGGSWNADDWGRAEFDKADALVKASLDAGIGTFDHADIYCRGKAEAVFGAVLSKSPGLRDSLFIQTKCGIRPGGSADWKAWNAPTGAESSRYDPGRYDFSSRWILNSVDASLRRLGCGHIDRLLLHRPDPLMEPGEVAGAFSRLKQEGKVLSFGVSNFSSAQISRLNRALSAEGIRVEANQIELSLLHHDAIETGVSVNQRGWAGEPWKGEFDSADGTAAFPSGSGTVDLAAFCTDNRVELQAWGCLIQGKLSGRSLPKNAPPALAATAALTAKIAAERGVSAEAIVLSWTLRLPYGVRPVIGTSDPKRIAACAQASAGLLSREEWYALYEAARGAPMP
jgi:predicted oxidoreductase